MRGGPHPSCGASRAGHRRPRCCTGCRPPHTPPCPAQRLPGLPLAALSWPAPRPARSGCLPCSAGSAAGQPVSCAGSCCMLGPPLHTAHPRPSKRQFGASSGPDHLQPIAGMPSSWPLEAKQQPAQPCDAGGSGPWRTLARRRTHAPAGKQCTGRQLPRHCMPGNRCPGKLTAEAGGAGLTEASWAESGAEL